jgi:YlmC/YmxH family sporulation protein
VGTSMMKISEFQTKDVVNILDGSRLGQVTDLEINVKQGRIDAIVVPGKDVVLVRIQETMQLEQNKPSDDEEGYRPY